MKRYCIFASILGLFLLLCTSTLAVPRPSAIDAERNRIMCGNTYGSASSPHALFCMKYKMCSVAGYVPAQPMATCDACILHCAATGDDSFACETRCARACGLE